MAARSSLRSLLQRARGPRVRWLAPDHLRVDGQHFRIVYQWGEWDEVPPSTAELFVLLKPPHMLEDYFDRFRTDPPRNIVEVGVYQGGGAALLWKLCRPERLIGLELAEEPAPALVDFVAREGAEGLRVHWGVDQADIGTVRDVVDRELDGAPLDLVIDDASHFYDLTRATFEALFPRLRPGGAYVIEDWGWAHWREAPWQESGGPFAAQPALSNLVFELVMASASSRDYVAAVDVRHHHAVIVRGPAPIAPPMPLTDLYVARDATFRPVV